MVRRVGLLNAGGHLTAPVRVVVVVHGHPEDLPRRGLRRAVNRFAGPTGAVDRGGLAGSARTATMTSAGAFLIVAALTVSPVMLAASC